MVIDFLTQLDNLMEIDISDLPIFQIMHPDVVNIKREIVELQRGLPALEIFSNERQFKAMVLQSKEELATMSTETERIVLDHSRCIKELQANSCKLGAIKQCPKLIDMKESHSLAKLSRQIVRNFKIFNEIQFS